MTGCFGHFAHWRRAFAASCRGGTWTRFFARARRFQAQASHLGASRAVVSQLQPAALLVEEIVELLLVDFQHGEFTTTSLRQAASATRVKTCSTVRPMMPGC